MAHIHHYNLTVEWTGDQGTGTDHYRSYKRDHVIRIAGKPDLSGSADPTFRGDPTRHNPEDMLVAALSACHMMSYLHVCAINGVVVTSYVDEANGSMETFSDGSGRFTEVVLHPRVTVREAGMSAKAEELHQKAYELCFIANSVNFRCGASRWCEGMFELTRPNVRHAGTRRRSVSARRDDHVRAWTAFLLTGTDPASTAHRAPRRTDRSR